jgi:hypothetical protein
MTMNRKLPPWLRQKKVKSGATVGVTWYTEEEWAKVKRSSVDSDRFEDSYSQWVSMAERARREMLAVGIMTEKVFINSEELQAWCIAHGKRNDASARSEYVSEALSRGHASDA